MYFARSRRGTRPMSHLRLHHLLHRWRKTQMVLLPLLLLGGCLLAISGWLPVTAQTASPSAPDTVVLPPVQIHLPLTFGESTEVAECLTTSSNSYETTRILGNPRDPNKLPIFDPDINLLVRGFKPTSGTLGLIGINGPTDDDAPQLAHLFRPMRVPAFTALYQVYDWNWACCPGGELGQPIANPDVTLVEMATTPGELLYPAGRHANIDRDFVAMVLYAEKFRITFTYTRDDSPAQGYVIHLDNLCVDPNLLALYTDMHRAGRDALPALRRGDSIGIAHSESVQVAVRDTGSFMDPRSGKDWWQDTVRAMIAAQNAAAESTPPTP